MIGATHRPDALGERRVSSVAIVRSHIIGGHFLLWVVRNGSCRPTFAPSGKLRNNSRLGEVSSSQYQQVVNDNSAGRRGLLDELQRMVPSAARYA